MKLYLWVYTCVYHRKRREERERESLSNWSAMLEKVVLNPSFSSPEKERDSRKEKQRERKEKRERESKRE